MRRNVLLIDDDKDLHELVTCFLEQAGFVVRSAQDGFTALEELKVNHYDLVTLDISMPRLNGFHVLRSIRAIEKFKNLPVIMMTGSDSREDLMRVKNEVSDYVLKPPRKADLLSRIERILGGRPQFEELTFTKSSPSIEGKFEVAVRLVSLSQNGLVLHSPALVEKGFLLHSLQLQLFQILKIKHDRFKVVDCSPAIAGGHEYFISFLGMSPSDQGKIRDWILTKSFQNKNGAV